jgi:hypothetical protein
MRLSRLPGSFRLGALLLIGLALSAAAPRAIAVDQVTRRSDNVTLRGKFTSMNTQAITIKLTSGREEVVSVADIKTLRFDQEPSLLAQAQSNERSGALAAALKKYRQVQSDYSGDDKRLITDVAFLIARTQVRLSLEDPEARKAARQAMQQFRAANQKNFRYLEATLLEAAAAASAEDSANARTLLKEVQGGTVKGYQLQAGVQLGQLLLADGESAEALAAFNKVVTQSEGDSNAVGAHWSGLLGRALCQQQQGNFADAVATVESVIQTAAVGNTDILAEAWVQKGDCLRKTNEPRAALMAYLHVDVLYRSEPSQHAQSLFRLSALWGPAGHQDRADDAAARLTARYPNSEWAKKLQGG